MRLLFPDPVFPARMMAAIGPDEEYRPRSGIVHRTAHQLDRSGRGGNLYPKWGFGTE